MNVHVCVRKSESGGARPNLVQQRLRNQFVRRVVVFDSAKHGDGRRRLETERGGGGSVRDCAQRRKGEGAWGMDE